MDILAMFSLWKDALLSPNKTFDKELKKKEVRWRDGFFHLALALVISIPCILFLQLLKPFISDYSGVPDYKTDPAYLFASVLWSLLLGVLLQAFLINIGATTISGKSNMKRTYCLLAIYLAPLSLLMLPSALLPSSETSSYGFLAIIFIISTIALLLYQIYLTVSVVKKVYSLSTLKSIAALAIPIVGAIILFLLIILLFTVIPGTVKPTG